jgi:phage-related protein
MNPEKLECIFYRTGSGEEPVRQWLKKVKQEDSAAVRVIGADLDRVQWQWPISKPLVGSLGDGLYEVRSSVGRVEYRLIFCVPRRQLVVLHGFKKKTRKTPKTDRDLALRRKKEIDP